MFQLPGAPTDPSATEECRIGFVQFNTDRSGVSLDTIGKSHYPREVSCPDVMKPDATCEAGKEKDCIKVLKYASDATAKESERREVRNHAVNAFMQVINEKRMDLANIRELTHFVARATECGEGVYELARSKNLEATTEDDSWFQHGCMRWIIRTVHKELDVDAKKRSPYVKQLIELGFSLEHTKRQYNNLYKDGKLIAKDDNLNKKGWLNPLTDSLCRKARPNGGVYDSNGAGKHRTKGPGKSVFRFFPAPPKNIPKTKWTANTLNQVGLAPLSPYERAYQEMDMTKAGVGTLGQPFHDDSKINWGVGGNVWMINGDKDPENKDKYNEFAAQFLAAREEQLLTTAAGPSGTTDEFLQMFDYAGLTQKQPTGKPELNKFHLINAMLGAFANMGAYYHHSFLEVMQGAGADLTGKNVVFRDFSYNPKGPFDWLSNIPLVPGSVMVMNWEDKAMRPTFRLGDADMTTFSFKDPLKIENVLDVYARLHNNAPLEALFLRGDFPNQYIIPEGYPVNEEIMIKYKGPHYWTQSKEGRVDAAALKEQVCTNDKFPADGLYRRTLCGVYNFVNWGTSGVSTKKGLTPYHDLQLHFFRVGIRHGMKADKFLTGGVDEPLDLLVNAADAKLVIEFTQAVDVYHIEFNFMRTATSAAEARKPKKPQAISVISTPEKGSPVTDSTTSDVSPARLTLTSRAIKKIEIPAVGDANLLLVGLRLHGSLAGTK